ncbi:serine hydrolase domain-containing protein [Actinoplanes derwentensis]|uniref:CubicO group peptidase, beta-lactamase class C family n=1 Tax=Actinoplanes derwentensis TaxID=113562 RepID=A0A1H1T972_9ACTN|nr:serine hydrolase domain-containing protein [Actinoplanes derwentensis]GID89007.1 serine hydrolase [Actinoplanes derwentensis]SDS56149.1 CubicO group peptidase, beta-lactamase class C family [Actinoplanes derwentensis]
MTEVYGTVAPGFEAVRAEFTGPIAAESAQLAIYRHGELVVDLWTGEDTLTSVFSVSKGAAFLIAALLVQEGTLDLDAQCRSLPFPLTVRELLGHRSGLIGVEGLTIEQAADDQALARWLSGRKPFWEPGTATGYHALTIGALVDAELRAVTGRSVRQWFDERLREPYNLDLFLGLPQDQEARFRPVLPSTGPAFAAEPGSAAAATLGSFSLLDFGNSPTVRAGGQASAGGVGSARGVARMYAAAIGPVDGRPALLRPETIREFAAPYSLGVDLVIGEADHYALGFENPVTKFPWAGRHTLGHSGAAGSTGWGDYESGLAYGYVRRRFDGPDTTALAEAVNRSSQSGTTTGIS